MQVERRRSNSVFESRSDHSFLPRPSNGADFSALVLKNKNKINERYLPSNSVAMSGNITRGISTKIGSGLNDSKKIHNSMNNLLNGSETNGVPNGHHNGTHKQNGVDDKPSRNGRPRSTESRAARNGLSYNEIQREINSRRSRDPQQLIEDETDHLPDLVQAQPIMPMKSRALRPKLKYMRSVSASDSGDDEKSITDSLTNGHNDIDYNDESSEAASPPKEMPTRGRRPSAIDLSRDSRHVNRYRKASPLTTPNTDSPLYSSNPDMEIFRIRRHSLQMRRNSLKDLISDWPTLEYIEKPEYRLPEFREEEPGEARLLELRKMDPSSIYKSDHWLDELEDQECGQKEARIEFSCLYSNPNAKIRWYKNTREIYHGHKYNILSEGGTCRLIIYRIDMDDKGKYTCQADDRESTSARLLVNEKVYQYRFTVTLPESAYVREKNDLVLECVLSDTRPSVVWRINDEIIEYTPQKFDIFRREDRCILKIRNCKKDYNNSKVSCTVSGDQTSCTLTVDEPDYRFVRLVCDIDALEKESAMFECEMNWVDAPTQWLKNDKVIDINDAKYAISQDLTKRRLVINDICLADEALYSCRVQNTSSTAKLFVAPEVSIGERLQNTKAVENDAVKLKCKVKNPKNFEIKWFKDGIQLQPNGRYVMKNKEGRRQTLTMTIPKVELTDAGQYKCTIGDRETSCSLHVEPCNKPVTVDVDMVPREITVRAGRTFEIYVPYTGIPIPRMEWSKDGNRLHEGDNIEWEQTPETCRIMIMRAARRHCGEYLLTLTNQCSQEIVPITVNVLDRPQAPQGPLEVLDVYQDRCHLRWQIPNDDGGVKIDYYLVEQCVVGEEDWTEVGLFENDTQCGVTCLISGKLYRFRVRAVNTVGQSDPLISTIETLAKDPWDPPSRPAQPRVVDFDKDTVDITWTPSRSDGGSPIIKYVIEVKHETDPWKTVGMVLPVEELYAVVPDLEENHVYIFRVCGVNKAGRGEMSEPSIPVRTKATKIAPKIERDSFLHTMKLKEGQSFKIEVRFRGQPMPKVTWTKHGRQKLKSGDGLEISRTAESAMLYCSMATREQHSAIYTISVKNDYGSDSAEVHVVVTGVPSVPVGPLVVTSVRNTSAILSWKEPSDNGGRPLSGYLVEKCSVGSNHWEKASSYIPPEVTMCQASKLILGEFYQFRVTAVNDLGPSPHLYTTEAVRAKNPFDCPGCPGEAYVIDSDVTYISLAWSQPVTDGGAPIQGYVVERQEQTAPFWNRVNESLIKDCQFRDNHVLSHKAYQYRMFAVNEGGQSEPSPVSKIFKAKPLKEVPKVCAFGLSSDLSTSGFSSRSSSREGSSTRSWGGWDALARKYGLTDGTELLVVKAGEPIRIDLHVCGSPQPTVLWCKDKTNLQPSERYVTHTTDEDTHLYVAMSQRTDTGLYSVLVRNELGQSAFDTFVVVLDKPGPPQKVRVDELFSDRCVLAWSYPLDDGDSPVTDYLVEMCEGSSGGPWIRLPQPLTDSMQYNVKDLHSGTTYRFSVRAENLLGVSPPAYLQDNVVPRDSFVKASPPGRPSVVDSDLDFITLSWSPPDNNGGSAILGYKVFRTDSSLFGRWIPLDGNLATGCEKTDRSVESGHIYEYKISALTEAGESECGASSGPIKAKPFAERPRILLSSSVGGPSVSVFYSETTGQLEARVRAGQPLALTIPISGAPTPAVTWSKRGQVCASSARVKLSSVEEAVSLNISDSRRNDSELYTVKACNQHGEDIAEITIVVQDKPGCVDLITVSAIEEDRCTLSWSDPADNGGSDIVEYQTEVLEQGETRWRPSGTVYGGETSIIIKDLTPGSGYKFRVRSKNTVGLGDFLETDVYYRTSIPTAGPSFDETAMELTVLEGDTVKEKIACSGSRPLDITLQYQHQHMELNSERIRIKDLDNSVILLCFKDISRTDAGLYTLVTRNSSGLSAKLSIKLNVKGVCGACQGPLSFTSITKDGCTLSWRTPLDDGGCKILHYTLEKKEEGKAFWTSVLSSTKNLETTVKGLVQGKSYQFRVAAVNAIGRGLWLNTDLPVEAKMPYGPPGKPDTPEIADVSQNSISLTWKTARSSQEEHITGYFVEKRTTVPGDGPHDPWVRINQATPATSTSLAVGNLVFDQEYEFRVISMNEAGESPPSESSTPVYVRDLTGGMLPQFTRGLRSIDCTIGQDVKLNIEVAGSPEPAVVWYAGTRELPIMSSKYEIIRKGREHTLVIRQLSEEDSEEISAKAVNTAGSRTTRANITVKSPPLIQVPLLFQQPSTHDKGQTIKVTLSVKGCPRPTSRWCKKSFDGKTSEVCSTESSGRHETLVIEKSTRNDSGFYILRAENELGVTEAEIRITINDVADAPRYLKVEKTTHNSVSLSWKSPSCDGGSVVTQYVVETYDQLTSSWNKSVLSRYCDAVIPQLRENTEYKFRVLAENIYGLSEASETVSTVTVRADNDWMKNNGSCRSRRNSMQSGQFVKDYDKFYHDLWSDYKPVQVDFSLDNFYDHYDLVEELGSGSCGVVYRVVERETGRSFVAKIQKIDSVLERNTIRNEMSIMNQLHDQKLLQLYDAFDNKDEIILVMEYLSGGDILDRSCDESYKMCESEVVHYVRQICDMLRIIHELNIVHLGLRFENLLHKTRTSRDIKLIDFGLAAKLNPDDSVSVSMAVPDFSAPEVVNHDAIGFFTDMWNVGILTYALLSGLLPFSGKDDVETIRHISMCQWKFDPESFSDISVEAQDFISKLLVKDPHRRMTVYEALDHEWLQMDSSRLTKRIPTCRYVALRDRIKKHYADWPVPMPAIGIMSNFSSLAKLRPRENKIYQSYFDRREAMPRFIRRPHDCVIEEGGIVIFKCQITGLSPPIVTWYFNNTVLSPGIKYLPRYSGKNYEIKICRVKAEDKGEYTVRAENSWGRAERTVFLNVQATQMRRPLTRSRSVEPESLRLREKHLSGVISSLEGSKDKAAPSFSFPLRDRRLQDGVGVKLIACVDGKPPPQIKWKKDGEEIDENDRRYKRSIQLGICSLEILSCRVADAGKYTCEASNQHGTDQTSCNISVRGQSDTDSSFPLPLTPAYSLSSLSRPTSPTMSSLASPTLSSLTASSFSSLTTPRYSSVRGRMRKRYSIAGF